VIVLLGCLHPYSSYSVVLVLPCCAGADYVCREGLMAANSGNVPLSMEVIGGVITLPSGGHCQATDLQPGTHTVCDVMWSMSNAEVEMGEGALHVLAQVNTTDQPAWSTFYSTSAKLAAVQVPRMAVTLEHVPTTRPTGAGEVVGAGGPATKRLLQLWLVGMKARAAQSACSYGCSQPNSPSRRAPGVQVQLSHCAVSLIMLEMCAYGRSCFTRCGQQLQCSQLVK
jgi:hypothetical protein